MDQVQSIKGARILILFPHMVMIGGALTYTLRLAGELAGQGAQVAILMLQANSHLCEVPSGVRVLSLGGPLTSSLRYWLLFPFWQGRLDRAIAAWRPDVLVPQVFPSNWWGWLYKRRHPETRLVWVCHEPSAFIHSIQWIRALQPSWKSLIARLLRPLLKRMDVALVRLSDRAIANSRFTAAEMERVYGRVPDAVACPGIDFPTCPAGATRKERAIITVARLTKFKRVDFLLEVFREVLKAHPDLTYHIVGTGEEEQALRDLARRWGIGSRVVFHGPASDEALAELCRRSSLFLHGSVGEPFGMAPLEAIACGTPVVAHRSGGPAEFVTPVCGRLVDSLAAADWAREVSAYLDFLRANPGFPDRVRKCARPFEWSASLRPAIEVIAGLRVESGNESLGSATTRTNGTPSNQ